MVEYALVLTVLVVGLLGVIQSLEDNTADEVDNQAVCISRRPPPLECQLPAPTPTVPTDPGDPPPPVPPGAPGNPIPAEFTIFAPVATSGSPLWGITWDLEIRDGSTAPATPITDEVVSAQVRVTGSTVPGREGAVYYVDCTTDSSGACTMSFDSRWPDVTQVSFDVVSIGTETIYDFSDDPEQVVDEPAGGPPPSP